jgi:hypothetical protein
MKEQAEINDSVFIISDYLKRVNSNYVRLRNRENLWRALKMGSSNLSRYREDLQPLKNWYHGIESHCPSPSNSISVYCV